MQRTILFSGISFLERVSASVFLQHWITFPLVQLNSRTLYCRNTRDNNKPEEVRMLSVNCRGAVAAMGIQLLCSEIPILFQKCRLFPKPLFGCEFE
jgi:hypothetical protein